MKKVYCLYRVSTKKQVDKAKDDIPMQKIACTEFAERNNWVITKEFYEKGISGFKVSAEDRDAIQDLKEAALNHEFDVLLVYMFDRLGRRDDETPFVVEWFVKQGIEVWSSQEGQQRFENQTDKLLNYIRYWQANGESVKTSMRLKTRMSQLIILLSRPCTPDEYEAVARWMANDIGIDMFDDTTYQAHRLMYWPSTSIDGNYVFEHEENKPLDVDGVLAKYDNWKDVSSWPVSSRTVKALDRQVKKQEDPTKKKGLIGAFCRTYDIHNCINTYLTGIYTQCNTSDRYTYTDGSSSAGLVVYENGKFAYSNHATDPASGKLCNSFDLVRIHKFGDLDADVKDGTPVNKLPSYKSMCELIGNDEAVSLLMFKEQQGRAAEEFAEFGEDGTDNNAEWALKLEKNQNSGAYEKTLNVIIILENDALLKDKIRIWALCRVWHRL